jgi:host factor-I protein
MVKNQINVQDQFLNTLRRYKISVCVKLITGEEFSGLIKAFDNFSLILDGDIDRLIYKHAISIIIPSKKIDIFHEA